MRTEIFTRKDVMRHTAKRVAIAVSSTVVLTLALLGVAFGIDPETNIHLGTIAGYGVVIGATIATINTGLLTYRSSLLMQELYIARTELFRISHTDQLTGLLNRRGYDEAALKALETSSGFPAVALMCDIDRFKAINDKYGHEFGDKVLIEIGKVIKDFGAENGMVVARHGGEEFAALMIGITTERAIQRANALRQLCAEAQISDPSGATASITISIGLAISRDQATLPTMMKAADQALYLAKDTGRDRVVPADVDMIASGKAA